MKTLALILSIVLILLFIVIRRRQYKHFIELQQLELNDKLEDYGH